MSNADGGPRRGRLALALVTHTQRVCGFDAGNRHDLILPPKTVGASQADTL
jgi:hypothetical protein